MHRYSLKWLPHKVINVFSFSGSLLWLSAFQGIKHSVVFFFLLMFLSVFIVGLILLIFSFFCQCRDPYSCFIKVVSRASMCYDILAQTNFGFPGKKCGTVILHSPQELRIFTLEYYVICTVETWFLQWKNVLECSLQIYDSKTQSFHPPV